MRSDAIRCAPMLPDRNRCNLMLIAVTSEAEAVAVAVLLHPWHGSCAVIGDTDCTIHPAAKETQGSARESGLVATSAQGTCIAWSWG